jgi:transcription elongation factor GreB
MSKAFVKDNDAADDDDLPEETGLPAGVKNYMTPAGAARLRAELEIAEIVDPAQQKNRAQVFFGAHVTYASDSGAERKVRIVGIDEADLARGEVSWLSPIAKALLKARVGDLVQVRTPAGLEEIEIVDISYDGGS